MRAKLHILFALTFLIASSCMEENLRNDGASKNYLNNTSSVARTALTALPNDHLKIAVISDIHYLDPSLLQNGAENGEAFQNYLARDPKLLQFSDGILKKVMSDLKSEHPDILLIVGDLTKDGERVGHQAMVNFLGELKNANMKVYVVPGNHDINNPEAMAYDRNSAYPTPSISAEDFSTIYSAFGFENAIARDPNSLSYVCEPYPGLWILAIDANKYYENTGTIATIGGTIKPQTMQWIQQQMAVAMQSNITVLGLMHHNVVEHYAGQSLLDPGYVVDNWESTADALMATGLKVIFTGHYHANDVTERVSNGRTLFDIETGSLVTPPSPYRITILKNKELDINTNHVTTIDTSMPGGLDFLTYSNMFFSAHLDGYFGYVLMQPPFALSETDATTYAPLFRNAFMAHCAGDEKISPAEQSRDNALAQISPMGGMALNALWTDLNTKDNKLHIKVSDK